MNSLNFSIVKDLRFGLSKPEMKLRTFKHTQLYYIYTLMHI